MNSVVARISDCSSRSLLTKPQKGGRFVYKSLLAANCAAPNCSHWQVITAWATVEVRDLQVMVLGHTHAPLAHVTCVTTVGGCQAPSLDLPVTHFFSGDHQRLGLHSPSLHSGRQGLAASRPCGSALCPAALQSCLRREFDTKSANISLHEA